MTTATRTATKNYPVLTRAICAECGHPISAMNEKAEAVMNRYQGNNLLHRYCRQVREARQQGEDIPATCKVAELEY